MTHRAILLLFLLLSVSCTESDRDTTTHSDDRVPAQAPVDKPKGKLFIIGGGKRPPEIIARLIHEANLSEGGYGIVLPMASSEPDSAAWYGVRQFTNQGLRNVREMRFLKPDRVLEPHLDSLRKARMIYITGGDQNRFMEWASQTEIGEAIRTAYKRGAIIAGTSAGAAVMSRQMITGNELKHPDYESTFRHIEKDNIELAQGLGLLDKVIIDQHFIKRSRHNRLLSAVLEHPAQTGIGIDESTAILVSGDTAIVIGESQVLLFQNMEGASKAKEGLLGGRDIRLQVLLPGDRFTL